VCVITVAMVMLLKHFSFRADSVILWKQSTETKDFSLIHGLLGTRTSVQCSKTDFYVLTLRKFRN
jgi:hypothetical protein